MLDLVGNPNCWFCQAQPRKSWHEVLLDDRKKLGMDNADPQNRSDWRGRLRRLVKQVQPSVEDNRYDDDDDRLI